MLFLSDEPQEIVDFILAHPPKPKSDPCSLMDSPKQTVAAFDFDGTFIKETA